MRTRSQEKSPIIPTQQYRRRQRKTKNVPEIRSLVEIPITKMNEDTRTMQELLQCPTVGYGDAIVLPPIQDKNFELKTGLIQLVTGNQFHGFEREDPHTHIRWFNKLTSTLNFKDVPHNTIKLMLFPFSLEGAAWIWLDKEPPQSINT